MAKLPHRTTYADYLSAEQTSPRKHEFIDGVIVMMAGGSYEHDAIESRIQGIFHPRVLPGCRAYTSNRRFWIESTNRARYSDGAIICGPPMHPPHDAQAAINPVVIVEISSPSSEDDDDGDKRLDWQSLPSLQAYMLVAQDAQRVKVYLRERDEWTSQTYGSGDRFSLPRLDSELSVDDIYDGVLAPDGRSLLR